MWDVLQRGNLIIFFPLAIAYALKKPFHSLHHVATNGTNVSIATDFCVECEARKGLGGGCGRMQSISLCKEDEEGDDCGYSKILMRFPFYQLHRFKTAYDLAV